MKSPRQANAKSTPKKVNFDGPTCCGPLASKRVSPSSKTVPKLCNSNVGY